MMTRRFACSSLVLAFAALCLPATAQQPAKDPRIAELRTKLERGLGEIAAGFDGVLGIGVKDLTTGETFYLNGDVVFPQGSSIKIPVLLELLRQDQAGTLKLSERLEVKRAQMVGGSGVLQRFGDGSSAVSLRDLAALMIVLSDNTATNILIDRVGMAHVNDDGRVVGFVEKPSPGKLAGLEASASLLARFHLPASDRPYLASMGIYVFNRKVLHDELRENDYVLTANGSSVGSIDELQRILVLESPDEVHLSVLRGKRRHDVHVRPVPETRSA